MKSRVTILRFVLAIFIYCMFGVNSFPQSLVASRGSVISHLTNSNKITKLKMPSKTLTSGYVVNFDNSMSKAADFLLSVQSSSDFGWDWTNITPYAHSSSVSEPNLYGTTGLGLYYAYLRTNNASYKTALKNACDRMKSDATVHDAGAIKLLLLFQDLPGVTGTAYKDAAKSKYDADLVAHGGTATSFAEWSRDDRAAGGLTNGIIPWDLGAYAVAAQMLSSKFVGGSYHYHQDAIDIAEVIYKDSYTGTPGYFKPYDSQNNGWDKTYTNLNFQWYTLGISGIMDAFVSSGIHTDELPGLITILNACRFNSGPVRGAYSYSYGAHTETTFTDDDWQTTAYVIMSLANYNKSTYQFNINSACYYLSTTQDQTGAWLYGSTTYPEVDGECISALYFGTPLLPTPVPFLSWPIGNPTQYTNPPTFSWYIGTSSTGLTYEIQYVVATAPWPDDNTFATSAMMSYATPSLNAGVQYAWRVRSTNGISKSVWSDYALFTMAASTGGPVQPIASWPIENGTQYTNPPTLSWYLSSSGTGLTYEIQYKLASDTWPADGIFVTSLTTSFITTSLTGGVQYAWRVRSTNGTTKSVWSDQALFTMVASAGGPVQPIASWPIGNATQYTNPPTLSWYLGSGGPGLTYEIQSKLASDPWPADGIFVTSATMSFTTSSLTGGFQYAWRVRSSNGTTKSVWSDQALFTMAASTGGPVQPIASWPIGNTTQYTNPPILTWYLSIGGTGLTYEIQYVPASDPWPADGIFQTSATMSFTTTSLIGGVQYAWRVRSTNGAIKSVWSDYALFTMATSTGGPVQPIASWPIGNTTQYTNPPTLFWYLSSSGTGLTYEIQCKPASDPWPADGIFTTSATKSLTTTSLTDGVQYAWRVRSTNGTTKSDWSDPALFTMVANNAPVQPITGSPTNLVTVNTSSPELFWYLPTAGSDQHYVLIYSTSSDMSNAVSLSDINALHYKVENLNQGATYYWMVKSKKSDGTTSIASKTGSFVVAGVTAVDNESSLIPKTFVVSQNYPNPFNPTTTIKYGLPSAANVSIKVYDMLGQEVKALVNGYKNAGTFNVNWNGDNNNGSKVSSGTYIFRVISGSNIKTIKMVLLK